MVGVTVQGARKLVRWGGDVEEVIRDAGVRDPQSVLSSLKVTRDFRGKPVAVEFEPGSAAVLKLPITGSEAVSWTGDSREMLKLK